MGNHTVFDSNILNTVESFLDDTQCEAVWTVYRNTPSIKKAKSLLSRYLFADGMELTWNGKRLDMHQDFHQHMKWHWTDFGETIIDWILCIGLVPLTFVKLDTGDWVPTTIRPGMGFIKSTYKNYIQHFSYWDNMSVSGLQEKVIVLSGFGYDPSIHGNLCSLVHSLLPMEVFVKSIMECTKNAEKILSNPPLILKKLAVPKKTQLGIDYDYFGEFDPQQGISAGTEPGEYRTYTKRDVFQDPIIVTPLKVGMVDYTRLQLPDGTDVAKNILPQTKTDIISLTEKMTDQIFSTIGIPKSLAGDDNSKFAGNRDATNDTFKTTVLWWKERVGNIMTLCYNIIYGGEDGKHVLNTYFSNTRLSSSDILSGDMLFQLQQNNKVEINFPIPPFVTVDQLHTFYTEGAITPDEYCTYMRKMANLPPIEKIPYIPPREGGSLHLNDEREQYANRKEEEEKEKGEEEHNREVEEYIKKRGHKGKYNIGNNNNSTFKHSESMYAPEPAKKVQRR